jgi:mono/diheme cytochrome c family protein
VTEVPEHLLRRAKERRAALGGGGEGGEPPATPAEAPGTGAAASAVEPAAGAELAPAAAAAAPVEPTKPVPPYVAAALRRPRVPKYALPVLAALPVWALIYAGAMVKSTAEDPQIALGRKVYEANCSGCHATDGTGGTGRNLHEVLLTFPKVADHLAWIENGDPATPGTPYGDPKRPGGQRISNSGGYTTPMPGFKDKLTAEEIAAVARYERVEFGGEATTAEASGSDSGSGGGTTTTAGH